MTALSRSGAAAAATAGPGTDTEDWVAALTASGPGHEGALRKLHRLLLKAARYQVMRMRPLLAAAGAERIDELVNQAADEAMVALLDKLPTFEGRSRFTTWAYKFAILQAAVEVRRCAWRDREVPLGDSVDPLDTHPSPEQYAEAKDLSQAVGAAIERALTPHQRRIVIALIVDEVPIDVLAERLGTTRNALYKTLHDARGRLRAHLMILGYLPAAAKRDVRP